MTCVTKLTNAAVETCLRQSQANFQDPLRKLAGELESYWLAANHTLSHGTHGENQVPLYRAALDRLRPIAMSTLAMIMALLPLGAAISGSGDQMLQPLAIAIIAGMTVQLPLVLLAMPVLIGLTVRTPDPGRSAR